MSLPDAFLGMGNQPVEGLEEWAAARGFSGIAREGNTPFSVPLISQIEGNLWTGGCIDGTPLPAQFKYVISLYPWEKYRINGEQVSRLEVPLYDTSEGDPPAELVLGIAAWVNVARRQGQTLVHCQAGLNRSSLVTATALVIDGATPDEAISLIREKRSPACLCNARFESWLKELAD